AVSKVSDTERLYGPAPARPARDRAWVGEPLETGGHRNAVVMAALGTDVQVGDEVLAVDLRVARVALQPQAGGAVVVLLARGTVPPEEALKRHVASLPAWS